jgi:hypothetical protein
MTIGFVGFVTITTLKVYSLIQRDTKIIRKELNNAKNTEKIGQRSKVPKKGILKNKKVNKMLSGLKRRNVFRSSTTPYERLEEESEQRSPTKLETSMAKKGREAKSGCPSKVIETKFGDHLTVATTDKKSS